MQGGRHLRDRLALPERRDDGVGPQQQPRVVTDQLVAELQLQQFVHRVAGAGQRDHSRHRRVVGRNLQGDERPLAVADEHHAPEALGTQPGDPCGRIVDVVVQPQRLLRRRVGAVADFALVVAQRGDAVGLELPCEQVVGIQCHPCRPAVAVAVGRPRPGDQQRHRIARFVRPGQCAAQCAPRTFEPHFALAGVRCPAEDGHSQDKQCSFHFWRWF